MWWAAGKSGWKSKVPRNSYGRQDARHQQAARAPRWGARRTRPQPLRESRDGHGRRLSHWTAPPCWRDCCPSRPGRPMERAEAGPAESSPYTCREGVKISQRTTLKGSTQGPRGRCGQANRTTQAPRHITSPAPAALQPPGPGSVPACGEFCPVVACRHPAPLQPLYPGACGRAGTQAAPCDARATASAGAGRRPAGRSWYLVQVVRAGVHTGQRGRSISSQPRRHSEDRPWTFRQWSLGRPLSARWGAHTPPRVGLLRACG